MKVWFEDSGKIECSLERVKSTHENPGELFTKVLSLIPGLSQVELVEQDKDWVTIKTSEAVMKRTNIVRRVETESVSIEFDEVYKGGKMINVKGHFLDEFTPIQTGVKHRVVISDIKAPGIFGFFYRKFAGPSIVKIMMEAYKSYLEAK